MLPILNRSTAGSKRKNGGSEPVRSAGRRETETPELGRSARGMAKAELAFRTPRRFAFPERA